MSRPSCGLFRYVELVSDAKTKFGKARLGAPGRAGEKKDFSTLSSALSLNYLLGVATMPGLFIAHR